MTQALRPALQYSEGRSKPWSGAKLVNCFAEKSDGDKRDDFAVMLIPGTVQLANLSSSAIRASVQMGDYIYALAGTTLYQIDEDGTSTTISGTVASSSGRARMAMDGTQVAVVAGTVGYVLDSGTLAAVVDLPAVSDVAFLDGYFIWTSATLDQFVWTPLGDGTIYTSGDVTTVEGAPDGLVAVLVNHRDILFFGEKTIEIFYNTGDVDAPFQRQGNAFIERGLFGRDTAVKIDNGVVFLGDDRIVYRLDGYTPVRMSTHAIEYQLRDVTDAWALAYTQEGHKHYCLNTDQGTYCLDMATGAWHERKSDGLDYWRMGGAVSAWNTQYLTDYTTGKIYSPSLDVFTEDGDPIAMEIKIPGIDGGRERKTMYAFELMAETGVGNSAVTTPQVALSYSDDGGRTYSNELWRSLGVVGDYKHRVIWRRVGPRFRERSINLRFTDACRRTVFGYFADIQA